MFLSGCLNKHYFSSCGSVTLTPRICKKTNAEPFITVNCWSCAASLTFLHSQLNMFLILCFFSSPSSIPKSQVQSSLIPKRPQSRVRIGLLGQVLDSQGPPPPTFLTCQLTIQCQETAFHDLLSILQSMPWSKFRTSILQAQISSK